MHHLGGPKWTKHIIDDNFIEARQVYAGDMDNDGDMDVVTSSDRGNEVVWYENDARSWIKHSIDKNILGARCVYVADIDGDDDLDVIATGFDDDQVVWYENFLISVTGIKKEGPSAPMGYLLSQNCPNPFNPITPITYSIPVSNFVTLKVYDIHGKEIQTLVNEFKHTNVYTVDFNGSKLPSGIYYYELFVGNEFAKTKEMILLH